MAVKGSRGMQTSGLSAEDEAAVAAAGVGSFSPIEGQMAGQAKAQARRLSREAAADRVASNAPEVSAGRIVLVSGIANVAGEWPAIVTSVNGATITATVFTTKAPLPVAGVIWDAPNGLAWRYHDEVVAAKESVKKPAKKAKKAVAKKA